ncbi:MAG: DoxX family protein [Verrucomicrobia bacterium]|nr:MAG: DoxX family protein [Verrucomicrobiota bacterium]
MAEEEVTRAPSTIPQFVWRIVEIIIGGVFIYAGATKALDPIRFANDIDNYKILPWMIGVRLAFYLPWLEIFCGLALIARRLYLGGLSILTALVFIFVIATVSAKIRGLDISCGCFGHVSKNWTLPAHLALDFGLLIFLLLLLRRVRGQGGANLPRKVDV